MTALLLIAGGLLLLWQLWKHHRPAVTTATVTLTALYLAAHSDTAKTGATIAAAIGVTSLGIWLCAKRCGVCGHGGKLLPEHEGGHAAAGHSLGYKVEGAIVKSDHGWTNIPRWEKDPWEQMVIAASGHAGERLGGAKRGSLGGSVNYPGSDVWWLHKLAPKVAKTRGTTPEVVIDQANAEAMRRVSGNAAYWREIADALRRDGHIGTP